MVGRLGSARQAAVFVHAGAAKRTEVLGKAKVGKLDQVRIATALQQYVLQLQCWPPMLERYAELVSNGSNIATPYCHRRAHLQVAVRHLLAVQVLWREFREPTNLARGAAT